MTAPKISEQEFVELYRELGPSEMARRTGMTLRRAVRRAQRLRRDGIDLTTPSPVPTNRYAASKAHARIPFDIADGFVIVASDCHYWPGDDTLMHRALLWACKEFKPLCVILNGDVMDFPTISRFPPIGWETLPKVAEEIEFAQEKTHEIAKSCKPGTRKIWTLGNHDKRFESRLAAKDPEYAKVHGVHLKDHFPDWEPCWSVYINSNAGPYSCLIKHRFKGGINDIHNNLLWAGNHTVTGHTHAANVRALTYYNERTIWGVNTGCVAEPGARAFEDYTEDNPKNWRSGFGIMRWEKGTLLQPQLVLKFDSTRVQIANSIVTP